MSANWLQGNFQGYIIETTGDYHQIRIDDGINRILDLKITGTAAAVVSAQNGVERSQVADWLWNVGMTIANDGRSKGRVLTIYSHDIANGELITNWGNLQEEKEERK
jgi:hypothetical protein